MTPDDVERIADFLRRKMCKPCRDTGPNPEHAGCCEASDLLEIVEREQ